jgi:hypothetical protein
LFKNIKTYRSSVSREEKSLQDLDPDGFPLRRGRDVQGQDSEVEGSFSDVAGLEPTFTRLIQERVQVDLLAGDGAGRVHHVQSRMNLNKKTKQNSLRNKSIKTRTDVCKPLYVITALVNVNSRFCFYFAVNVFTSGLTQNNYNNGLLSNCCTTRTFKSLKMTLF